MNYYTFWGETYFACFAGSMSLPRSEEMITYTSSFSLSSGWTICTGWCGMRTENAFSWYICREWASQMSGTENRCETELKKLAILWKKIIMWISSSFTFINKNLSVIRFLKFVFHTQIGICYHIDAPIFNITVFYI